jgi:hypothetical protein
MVENLSSLCKPTSGRFLVMRQSRQVFFSPSEAPSKFFCWHLHPPPRNMALHPHLASVALKRKPATMGKRAPRASSIVDGFCRLPSQEYGADSVAPDVCLLARAAARASPATIREDGQNDSTLATIPNGPTAVVTAVPCPRSCELARLFHVGRSDSLAQ